MGDRCTGHCCRKFTLPMDPAGLKEAFDAEIAWKAEGSPPVKDAAGGLISLPPKRWQDIEIIQPMVRYLGLFETNPSTGKKGPQLVHVYTCNHLQENGDCGIYENRPSMCSAYPYGGPCTYEGCELDGAEEATRLKVMGEKLAVDLGLERESKEKADA